MPIPASWSPRLLSLLRMAMRYCFIFLYLAAAGAGPWSVDAMRART